MGGICSKKKKVRQHELSFMGVMTEGAYKSPGLLDAIFDKAVAEGEQDQIFNAKDDDGDLPIHKASMYGNPTCLQWVIDKWAETGQPSVINALDHNGYTPLYLVCYKGFLGSEGVAGNSPEIKQKRIECVNILLKVGADINYHTPKLRMTALHWAAYQGDADMVQLLLQHNAMQDMTAQGNTPVDIAGFMKHTEVVLTFCKELEHRILKENRVRMAVAAGPPDEDNEVAPSPTEKTKLSQVSPGGVPN